MDKETAIKDNYKHIVAMARRFQSIYDLGEDMTEDIISDGCVSLMELVDSFDESLGVTFWSYAKKGVYGTMLSSIQRMITTFDVSEHLNRQFAKISRILKQYPNISDEELIKKAAAELKVSDKKAAELVGLYSRSRAELDENSSLDSSSPDESLFEIADEKTMERVQSLLDTVLKPRHAEYIRLYYGIGYDKLSCAEIAEEFCVTESAVRKAINAAVEKIKNEL